MRATILAFAILLCGSISSAVGQPPPGVPQTVRVFTLKNADAEKLRAIVITVFDRQGIAATVDARTNSLVIRGDADTMKEVEKLIAKLDEPISKR